MAPIDSRLLLIQVLKSILFVSSSALQLHFVLLLQIMMHKHNLNQELLRTIEERNRAMHKYVQLRNRFLRRKKKRFWKNPGRTEKWWKNMLNGSMLPEEWTVNFRMSKSDFMKLEEKLRPYIQPCMASFRGDTISSVKKLAVTLYYLKDQGSLRMTSNLFGIAPTTLSATIRKVCHAITTVLGPQLIKFPTTKDDLQHLTSEFENKFDFPMLAGCVDGTHIPIKQPSENAHDYFCYKMKFTLNVQAVCDHKGCFLDVDCSWPGSVHDAKVFSNSSVHKLFQESRIPNIERKLSEDDNLSVGPVLLGDPAYPLLPGLMKEFATCNSNGEVIFNRKLRSVRNQIECAFGRLKARWRILNRPIDLGIDYVPTIVYSCFVLHNYCEQAKSYLCQDAVIHEMNNDKDKQGCNHHSEKDRLYTYNTNQGNTIRDIFKKYFERLYS